MLDGVRVVPEAPPPSAVRTVHPLSVGDAMPATRFVDQRGHAFRFADFHGTSVVLAFVYTRCRDARECPLDIRELSPAAKALGVMALTIWSR